MSELITDDPSSGSKAMKYDVAPSVLASLRYKLLDLSTRNTLLSCRQQPQSLRVLSSQSNSIYHALTSGIELGFAPLVKPLIYLEQATTELLAARSLHYSVINTIPSNLKADTLVKSLDGLYLKSRSALEESGANRLYLAFGFLSWADKKQSSGHHLAPLFLIPVRIEKAKLDYNKGVYQYTIAYTEEPLHPNLSLQEKLRQDFDLQLPVFDNAANPASYIARVSQWLNRLQGVSSLHQHTVQSWSVHSYASLSLFEFGKLLMHLDLAHYADSSKLNQYQSFMRLLGYQDTETDKYQSHKLIKHRVPRVLDADASQQHVLAQALQGQSLVVQGPPGTGKSQTIANIIAAALEQGKRVLFVAEKFAAIDVVRRRLKQANLGEFCLELHSHRSNKRKVLNELHQRLLRQGQYKDPRKELQHVTADFERLEHQLVDYAAVMDADWKATGLSVHHILSSDLMYRSELSDSTIAGLLSEQALVVDSQASEHQRAVHHKSIEQFIETYQNICQQVQSIAESTRAQYQVEFTGESAFMLDASLMLHPWFGVHADAHHYHLLRDLSHWQKALNKLQASLVLCSQKLNVPRVEVDRWPIALLIEQDKRDSEAPSLDMTNLYEVLINFPQIPSSFKAYSLWLQLFTKEHVLCDQGALPYSDQNFCLPHLAAALQELDDLKQEYTSLNHYWSDQALVLSESDTDMQPMRLCEGFVQYKENIASFSTLSRHSLSDVLSIKDEALNLSARLLKLEESMSALSPYLYTNTSYDQQHETQHWIGTSEQGLQNFLDVLMSVQALPLHLWAYRHEHYKSSELDQLLPKLHDTFKELRQEHRVLSEFFYLERLPSATRLREIRQQLSVTHKEGRSSSPSMVRHWLLSLRSVWRQARYEFLCLSKDNKPSLDALSPYLGRLERYAELHEQVLFDAHYMQAMPGLFMGMHTGVEKIETLRAWYVDVALRFGGGLSERYLLAESVRALPVDLVRNFQSLIDQGLLSEVQEVLSLLRLMRSVLPASMLDSSLEDAVLGNVSTHCNSEFAQWHACLAFLETYYLDKQQTFNVIHEHIERYINWHQQVLHWMAMNPLTMYADDLAINGDKKLSARGFLCEFLSMPEVESVQFIPALLSLRTVVAVHHWVHSIADPTLRSSLYLYLQQGESGVCTIEQLRQSLSQSVSDAQGAYQRFAEHVDVQHWLFSCQRGDSREFAFASVELSLNQVCQRNQDALDRQHCLAQWQDYWVQLQKLQTQGFSPLLLAALGHEQGLQALPKLYQAWVYHQLADEIMREELPLRTFSGIHQQRKIDEFVECETSLQGLQQAKTAWSAAQHTLREGVKVGKVGDYTELALIHHEIKKKTRHIPIRQLLSRAGNTVQALKPCFMMGPMSVAQYLAPEKLQFDLVIMDEASQLKPEEALGALMRGHQVIVVGDTNQLPPTRFFERVQHEDEHKSNPLEHSESILVAAQSQLLQRSLNWHYRSQHESLIAFSNRMFYGDALTVLPSPFQQGQQYGLQYAFVDNAIYQSRRNAKEADEIVASLVRHMKTCEHESLGVVAMNLEQRDLIFEKLTDCLEADTELRQIYERNQESLEPLFVKNLENVQGDERDVIYISFTYGRELNGSRLNQRFGPLNSDDGWRRLNVLLTRAKKRMHVFCSFHANEIVISPQSSRGVQAFQQFLLYSETGLLRKDVGFSQLIDEQEATVPFRLANYIAHGLREKHYQVDTHVGVCGQFVDLAIYDPRDQEGYIMVVVCDDARFSTLKSVHDREYLRPKVLQRLGWHVYRAWTPEWYSNPTVAMQCLEAAIQKLL